MANNEKSHSWFYHLPGGGAAYGHSVEFAREVTIRQVRKHLVKHRGFTDTTVSRLDIWTAESDSAGGVPRRKSA